MRKSTDCAVVERCSVCEGEKGDISDSTVRGSGALLRPPRAALLKLISDSKREARAREPEPLVYGSGGATPIPTL